MKYYKLLNASGDVERLDKTDNNPCNGMQITETEYTALLQRLKISETNDVINPDLIKGFVIE